MLKAAVAGPEAAGLPRQKRSIRQSLKALFQRSGIAISVRLAVLANRVSYDLGEVAIRRTAQLKLCHYGAWLSYRRGCHLPTSSWFRCSLLQSERLRALPASPDHDG